VGWQEMKQGSDPSEAAEAKQQAQEAQKALERCVRSALAPDAQKPLREWLKKVAFGGAYRPGDSFADTAHKDGTKALAAKLLKLGGMIDD
jgi:hypothetical protein